MTGRTSGFIVVRPEPGNAATVARLRAGGYAATACPLFVVRPLPWTPLGSAGFDAVLLTSANAIRHGGDEWNRISGLPVVAVGEATAAAARRRGLTVALVGTDDAREAIALAAAHGLSRLIHLSGRERSRTAAGVPAIAVYASEPLPIDPAAIRAWRGGIVLLHSARAARRVAELAGGDRGSIGIAAISDAVRAAAGPGWRAMRTAARPTDAALIAAATHD